MGNAAVEPNEERPSATGSNRHRPSGRWRLGFALALITACLWSTAPIAVSILLDRIDAPTTTFYRFASVSFILATILACRGRLPPMRQLMSGAGAWLIVIAGIGLTGNFAIYQYALNYIPPGTAQLVMQIAPFMVLLGSVLLYRESLSSPQLVGLAVLIVGFLLFFNRRLSEFSGNPSDYATGALLIMLAATCWSSCVLAQKQLLTICTAPSLMLVLYVIGAVIMLPLSTLSQIRDLSTEQYIVLGYCVANMLISYTCFAEALQHWESSRVSTVVCTSPLLTLAWSYVAATVWPGRIMPDQINTIGLLGAVVVVTGSMLCSFGGRQLKDIAIEEPNDAVLDC